MGRTANFRVAVVAAGLVATVPATAVAADWKLEAGVSARETFTDNATLSATNRESDFITELNPYISASKHGARLQADFRYVMQNLFYANLSNRSKTNHQLAGKAKAELWEQELFVDATASISQQVTSLLGPIGADTTSATGNLTNVSSVTVSPYWQHRFGTAANLLARYSHNEVSYGGSGFSSSSTNGVNVGLGSGSAFNDLFWALNYSDTQTDYKNRPDVGFTTTTGTVGYAVTPRWRVSGTLGYQDHSYAGAKTALTGSLWSVGVSWAPTNRTNVSVSYGDNPFGKTHGFSFKHRTQYTTWDASYSEALSTGSSQFSGYLPLSIGTLGGQSVLYAGQGNILTNAVFLNKMFRGGVSYSKGKSDLNLSVFRTIQESQQSQIVLLGGTALDPFLNANSISQRGATATWNWRLSPVLTSNVGIGMGHLGIIDTGRRDTYSTLQVGLTRTFNADLSGNVMLRHQERSSNQSANDTTENALIGAVYYKF